MFLGLWDFQWRSPGKPGQTGHPRNYPYTQWPKHNDHFLLFCGLTVRWSCYCHWGSMAAGLSLGRKMSGALAERAGLALQCGTSGFYKSEGGR